MKQSTIQKCFTTIKTPQEYHHLELILHAIDRVVQIEFFDISTLLTLIFRLSEIISAHGHA